MRTGLEVFTSGKGTGYMAEKAETDQGWTFPAGDELNELGYNHMFTDMFDALDQNMAPKEAFEGRPTITLIRMVEEGNIVVAEGNVKFKVKNGPMMDAMFCDVFHFEGDKIKQLTGYIMTPK